MIDYDVLRTCCHRVTRAGDVVFHRRGDPTALAFAWSAIAPLKRSSMVEPTLSVTIITRRTRSLWYIAFAPGPGAGTIFEWPRYAVFTIGHSRRPIPEFVRLLRRTACNA
jgi:hypothetical protein